MLIEPALVGLVVVESMSGSKPENSTEAWPPSGHDFEQSPAKWSDDNRSVQSTG